jgi:NAD-dependent SIR2 family protein deacetylase
MVDEITIRVHPTVSPSTITLDQPPFQIDGTSVSSFEIKATIKWTCSSIDTNVKHSLDFSRPLTIQKLPIPTQKHESITKKRKTSWTGPRMKASRNIMHGCLGHRDWDAPRIIVQSDLEARPGYKTKNASEYEDEPWVLREKVEVLANLLKKAKNPIAYTGAGISTASGIKDYASKAKNSVAVNKKKIGSGLSAQPTFAHRVLAALYRAGHLKHWVQQNHDGLPQKAGFPPEHLNEIHGAWFDPSNPVVPMSGSLRGDLCEWMEQWEEKTDLTLAMGTSLCGMNADRMVETPAIKAAQKIGDSTCLGAVIVGLQQTQYDEVSSVRIYAKTDHVMHLLAKTMQLDVHPLRPYEPNIKQCHVVNMNNEKCILRVPYDKNGKLIKNDPESKEATTTTWDLSKGAKVKVTMGPGKNYVGSVIGRNVEGHIQIRLPFQRQGHPERGKKWQLYTLGSWWLETATKGTADILPVVNTTRPAVLKL